MEELYTGDAFGNQLQMKIAESYYKEYLNYLNFCV